MNTQAISPSPGTEPGGSPADGAGTPGTGHGSPPGEQFFNRIRTLGVVRPDEGRWAAGVCAGLARHWGLDPLLVRGLFLVVSIVTGFGLGLYGLLWMFLPHPDGRIHAQQILRGIVTAGFVGSALFVLNLPLGNAAWGWDGRPFHAFGNLAVLILIGLGIWWLMNRRPPTATVPPPAAGSATAGSPGDAPVYGTPAPGTTPRSGGQESETSAYAGAPTYAGAPSGYHPPGVAPTPVAVTPRSVDVRRPSHALTLTSLGVALVAAGAVLGWNLWIGGVTDAGLVATAVALGVIALGIVLAGIVGRRAGGLTPVAIVLALVAGNGAAWQDTTVNMNSGSEVWAPVSASAAGYDLGAGRAVLDLTAPALVTGATSASPVNVRATIGAGELVVIVPKGASSQVDATVGLGAVTNQMDSSKDRGGAGVTQTITSSTDPVLIVTVRVGLGHVEIVPQGTEVTR